MTTAEEHSPWPSVLKRLRLDWRAVFATHLFFTGLGIIVFAPLISILGRLLLSFSEQPALADQDIARFLLSPVGIIGLVVMAALLIAILAFEQAAMMALGAARLQGLYPGTLGALRLTGARARTITAFALRLVVRVLIITLPFLTAAAAVAWFFAHGLRHQLLPHRAAFRILACCRGDRAAAARDVSSARQQAPCLVHVAVASGMATPDFIRRNQTRGKRVLVWTVNDALSLSRMMSLGVDGVITDEPALAREVIAERADLNPAERLLMHTAVLFGRPEPQRAYRDDSP